ncbi:MAG TPA: glycoside hydrolase domain-containing protein [Phycisphaerae bacterium]|nr:glycoside hydrolase domain-containing protein [Phycisphaerae bacterium]
MKMMFWVKVKTATAMLTVAVTAATLSAEPAAVQLWTSDLVSDAQAGKSSGKLGPITIVGARGGAFSGRVVVESTAPIKGLRGSAGSFSMEGTRIPPENVRVRYAVCFDGTWSRWRPQGLDILLESPPGEVAPYGRKVQAAVWVTVQVPKGAKPGLYKGSLKVQAVGLPAKTVPVELKVADWTVPDNQDFRTWVGMIQSPDSLALEYDVPLWSDKHWELIAKSFSHMKVVGCRIVFVPILCRTNFGNAESMVRWIPKGKNRFDYDFTIMEKYLDAAEKHLGKPKLVVFQVWDVYLTSRSLQRSVPFRDREEAKAIRQSLQGKGPRVTVVAPQTGKPEAEPFYLPPFEDPASMAMWRPLFAELRKRMRGRGLEKTMMLGMIADVEPTKEQTAFLQKASGGLQWAKHAHPGRLLGKPAVGNKLLHKIADLGYEAHVYGVGYQVNPDKGRHYGWRHPELVVRFARNGWPNMISDLQVRLLPMFNITGDQRGIGRVGADVWYVIKDKRGQRAGAAYHRYPEVLWRNLDIESWMLAPGPDGPVATARLENLREGVQLCEARIAIEKALLDPASKAKLGAKLAADCEALLNERQRAMWRTVWPVQADLDKEGVVRARNPIESLWTSWTKKDKSLPGFWDAAARKARRDAAAEGRTWFAASGWQARDEKLFTLAGEVERKLGAPGTMP